MWSHDCWDQTRASCSHSKHLLIEPSAQSPSTAVLEFQTAALVKLPEFSFPLAKHPVWVPLPLPLLKKDIQEFRAWLCHFRKKKKKTAKHISPKKSLPESHSLPNAEWYGGQALPAPREVSIGLAVSQYRGVATQENLQDENISRIFLKRSSKNCGSYIQKSGMEKALAIMPP